MLCRGPSTAAKIVIGTSTLKITFLEFALLSVCFFKSLSFCVEFKFQEFLFQEFVFQEFVFLEFVFQEFVFQEFEF